ncbi:CMRF35-like molecule 1 [Salmo trutta]|uniref:CMRF35-like molecule 1 n=1 Tax=Salmo trutta TaxID=8032 RepID=UPI0011305D76|nr:CMRF35-like molecule 1 [Salmo trutta]
MKIFLVVSCGLLSGEFCLLSGEFCLLSGEFSLLSGEFCLLSGEFCLLSGEFCLLSALCVVESDITKTTGVVGGQVTFVCSFLLPGTNCKYFCNGKCSRNSDILIQTEDSNNYIKTGRYSIDDRGDGDFTVTISNLKTSDSGTYWCGVDRFFKDSYQEVHLTVTDEFPSRETEGNYHSTDPNTTVITLAPEAVEGLQTVLGTSVVIMLCLSLTVLVAIYQWRRDRKLSNSNPDTGITGCVIEGTLNTTTQDSTYQTLNKTTHDSTYQTLNTTTQDSTYQTLNKTTQDSTYQTLIHTTTDPI